MDKKLLSILCCPVTHKGLSLARADLLKSVNAAIDDGKLVNHDGAQVAARLTEARWHSRIVGGGIGGARPVAG